MWILIQLLLSPAAFFILSSNIWTDLNNTSESDTEELDHYTETELHNIELFRVIMKDAQLMEYEKSDDFLIRWLREANMDLKTANQSLRNAKKWRQDNQIDIILNKTFPIKKFLRPCNVEGFDKKGGPVIIYKLKGFDVRNNLASGYREKLLSQFYQCLEISLQESISGSPKSEHIRVTPGIGIFDMEGGSLKQHGCLQCVDLSREVCINGFLYYPRNFKFLVAINEPLSENNTAAGTEDNDAYTDAELHNIGLFRGLTSDVLEKEYERSDDFLIRWLREANMDLKSANQSLRHAMKWRQDNQIDTILNKTFTTTSKKLPQLCYVDGFDKNGGPIIVYKSKGYDVRNILTSGYREKIISQLYQCFERYLQKSISGGPNSEQTRVIAGTGIFELQGANLKQHGCLKCVDLYREVCINFLQFYPRITKFVVVINAAPFVRQVIEILKPILSPYAYAKKSLNVFGNDREEWTQFLLSVIPKDQLPPEYGGTKLKGFDS